VITVERRDYPGTPLTVGSTGSDVAYYTLLLSRIAYYFDAVENPELTDTYTEAVADATKSVQEVLGLPVTGIVDAETWNAVEALSIALLADAPNPDATVAATAEQQADYPARAVTETSASPQVLQVQQWLNQIGAQFCTAGYVDEDSFFGAEETAKIKLLQQMAGLDQTGTVDQITWAVLRAASEGVLPTQSTGPALERREAANGCAPIPPAKEE
jgi:peptidoglycan hydrolase-like protein with peptidoglycan-binding domain